MSEIPGWFDWQDLYAEAVASAPNGAHFVELGTFFGKSADHLARLIAASGKRIAFDTWDNWRGIPPAMGYKGWLGRHQPREPLVRQILSGLPVSVCTGDALAAAGFYGDGTLSLVFVDDDHSTAHVLAECRAWWPKVGAGGVMAGHDYEWPSVERAVSRWATEASVLVESFSPTVWVARKP